MTSTTTATTRALSAIVTCFLIGTVFAQTPSTTTKPTTKPTTAPVVINPTIPVDYVELTAGDSGVTLRAPASWKKAKPNSANAKLNLIVDATKNSVNLVIVKAMPGQTVEQTLSHVPPGLQAHLPGFDRLVSADAVDLAGTPAARIVYEATINKVNKLRFCQFFVIKDDKQYVLTYTSAIADYERFLPAAEQVAASMKVP